MSTLILSGYTDNMAEVGDRCTATQRKYAERHGFHHEVVREFQKGSHPSSQKIRLIQERLRDYEAIVWFDADTAITNPEAWVPDRSGGKVMDVSVDWCAPYPDSEHPIYVSCGNFVIWNREETMRFLDFWARHTVPYATRPHGCWEQDGLIAAMKNHPWLEQQVRRLPREVLNTVHPSCVNREFPTSPPKPWSPGCFLLHLTNSDRLTILNGLGL